jgi:hypothetical protein
MKRILHQGRSRGGLYPLGTSSSGRDSNKQVYAANKPSLSRWHSRLGHPALPIVDHVLSLNYLPSFSDKSCESVCDACQMAKSHQTSLFKVK